MTEMSPWGKNMGLVKNPAQPAYHSILAPEITFIGPRKQTRFRSIPWASGATAAAQWRHQL